MSDKTNDIVQMIDSYTDQIERYENISTWFAAFSVICILGVIIMAIFLLVRYRNEDDQNRSLYDCILSAIFLIIPSITTLYLYVFSMNMRKVALYRGYLSFLEQRWNVLAGEEVMLFDSQVIKEFFSFNSFLVNGMGPVVMAVFIIFSIVIGFGMSIHFVKKLKQSKIKNVLRIMLCVVTIVCILFDGLCTYYLSTNDNVTRSVVEYCEK
jgi:heme/copper-type cytochrome/quinol oxidase subunit 2